MSTATLKTEIALEAKLMAWVYLGAIVVGCGSAFITTHTRFKIVTSGAVPPSVVQPAPAAPAPRVGPAPVPLKFGFPDPVELDPYVEPVTDAVARSMEPSRQVYAYGRSIVIGPDGLLEPDRVDSYLPNSVVVDTALAWQKTKLFETYVAMERAEKSVAPKLVAEESKAVAPKRKWANVIFHYVNPPDETTVWETCTPTMATHKVGVPSKPQTTEVYALAENRLGNGVVGCRTNGRSLVVMEKRKANQSYQDYYSYDPGSP